MATILEKANQILEEKNTKLLPENIREGINVLGINGTLKDLAASTINGTITAQDVVFGKVAYSQGEEITGELPVETSLSVENADVWTDDLNVTFKITNTTLKAIEANGEIMISAPHSAVAEAIGLTSEKIKNGETIIGVTGIYTGAEEPEDPELPEEPVVINTGKTYNFTLTETIAEDIDLVEHASTDNLAIMSADETTIIYCMSAYMIGKATITETGMDSYLYMDANVIDKLRELSGDNVSILEDADQTRGWKHVVMTDGVYVISNATVPETFEMAVGSIDLGGEVQDSLNIEPFSWLIASVEEVVTPEPDPEEIPEEEA